MFQGLTFALLGTPGGVYDLELNQVAGQSRLHLISHADRGGLRVFLGPDEVFQLSDPGHATSTGTWDGLLQK